MPASEQGLGCSEGQGTASPANAANPCGSMREPALVMFQELLEHADQMLPDSWTPGNGKMSGLLLD